MSAAKHTPGPWKVRSSGDVGTERMLVAAIYPVERDDPECIGNARLIAAAPDLLEALREIAEMSVGTTVGRTARAAIAKATGGAQ